ncbi:hypothetical protein HQ41_07595 [Porphyromonas sp. COT-290 OH860]|nr:hypothetical protein HQ41_07595 [Porphyromonas sp. COT-290 OH860]
MKPLVAEAINPTSSTLVQRKQLGSRAAQAESEAIDSSCYPLLSTVPLHGEGKVDILVHSLRIRLNQGAK